MTKYSIQVRQYGPGLNHHRTDKFTLVKTIMRKPWAECIGNFNPLFCRYKGKRMLLHSNAGDVSDPFRRTDDYANTFFIELVEPLTLTSPGWENTIESFLTRD